MSKYIDLEPILRVPNIRKVYEYDETGEYITYLAVPLEVLENAVEHKGFWSSECEPYYTCSSCKHTFSLFQTMKYCPNCGAKWCLEYNMNKTLIYKEDVIKLLSELENKVAEAEGWQEKCNGIFQANQIVQKIDPVDAKPTLYALWDLVTLKRNFGTLNGIRCSHCGNEHVHSNLLSYPNYCSNCGAKMILGGI